MLRELEKVSGSGLLASLSDSIEDTNSLSVDDNEDTWRAAFSRAERLSRRLLVTAPLRRTAGLIETAETEYMPGPAAQSAVSDTLFQSWWLMDLGIGTQAENLCSIASAVITRFGILEHDDAAFQLMAQSRLGVYEVAQHSGHVVSLVELLSGNRYVARVPAGAVPRTGQLWLTRLLPPLVEPAHEYTLLAPPCILGDPAGRTDWTSYLERAAGASHNAVSDALTRHFKRPPTATWWLEYVLNGYARTDHACVVLSGVPDRPETLPQHPDNPEPSPTRHRETLGVDVMSPNPMVRLRAKVWRTAIEHGFESASHSAFRDASLSFGTSFRTLSTGLLQRTMLAHACYGVVSHQSRTALDVLATEHEAALDDAERRELKALLRGRFSMWQIVGIRSKEAVEVFDLLVGGRVWLSQGEFPAGFCLGDAIAGWVACYPNEYKLEGNFVPIPVSLTGPVIRQTRAWLRNAGSQLSVSERQRLGLALPLLTATLDNAAATHRAPATLTAAGHEVVGAKAVFDVANFQAVAAFLRRRAPSDDKDNYLLLDADNLVWAMASLSKTRLSVATNSREGLDELKRQLHSELGAALKHRIDQFESPPRQAVFGDVFCGRTAFESRPPA